MRRLQCKECGAIHIELPYFLLPYKRYKAEVIESVLNGEDWDSVASVRTKKRWLNWCDRIWLPILYLLNSILKKDQDLSRPTELIKEKPKDAGWLKTAVMAIINSGEKVPTRYAYAEPGNSAILQIRRKNRMKNEAKREEKAVNRLTLVLPLLDESLDKAARSQKKKEISKESGVSERTLERYIASYRANGFDGLKPEPPIGGKNRLPKDFDKVLAEAEKLRREVPGRSVNTIINILEYEGMVKPGVLKRSTLQDHLAAAGLSAKQMRMTQKTGLASRRFQKTHRCQMYQGDIKEGPYLPIGENGKKVPTYLSVIIDDATRYVVAAKFYDNMTSDIIEDSL